MSDLSFTSVNIVNNISVTVPASEKFLTTFILKEQLDWFEDEIKFSRSYIKQGMKIIDIGSNYGLYTLTFASLIGDTGKVWAFEPAKSTASLLRKSILNNKFNNINLIQSGLSNRVGKAKLYLSENSELNSLSKDVVATDRFEKISLLTLDHCNHNFKWNNIDFIKLDAEGEELNILKKSEKTLSSSSPLIMYELKHGNVVNLPLIERFKTLGYESYRLLPGLNVLVPFDHNTAFDGYLLNVFCCKEDKAKELEEGGVLVRNWQDNIVTSKLSTSDYINNLVFGQSLKHCKFSVNESSDEYMEILNLYITSLSEGSNSVDRVSCLMKALQKSLNMVKNGEKRIERLVTFSRVAFDAGERTFGMKILSDLMNSYSNNLSFEIKELFLPASQRFENIVPDLKLNEWLFSSVLERSIEKHAFSSYFSQSATLPLFEKLSKLGFFSEDMQRRHKLVKDCFS